ncbi:MAG: hypothetical protein HC815_31435 [Richelia sp. RM1_1_1]|nr:hypothetical protein [Richelia sp. SM1_7_0]NJN12233.1 hypothetical protein [Richelia sp. RM1_1_1]
MNNKSVNLRLSERRLNILRMYASQKDTTMTHILEDFIDTLEIKNGDSLSTPSTVNPVD